MQRKNAESRTVIVDHTQNIVVKAIFESYDHEAVEIFLCEYTVHSDDEFIDRNLFV